MRRIAGLLCLVVVLPLSAQEKFDTTKEVQRDFGTDRFAAGKQVVINRAVSGDLIAAGGVIETVVAVAGDALLTGGTVVVSRAIGQSLYAAVGNLLINDAVKRNARVAGGRIEFSPISEVLGNVTAVGGEIELNGKVNGYVLAVGGRVLIDAIVLGNVEATSGQVELGPNARITGNFRYSSREPLKRDPAAQTNGGVEVFSAPGGWPVPENVEHNMGRGGSWIWTIGLLLVAALLTIVLPTFTAGVSHTLRHRPRMSLLIGFVTLVCTPIAGILLLITIIGVPLGLMTFLLYLLLLIVGYVTTGIAWGDWAMKRVRSGNTHSLIWRVAAAVTGVLIISILARIPWLGPWVLLAALLAGIGALVLQMWALGRQRASLPRN